MLNLSMKQYRREKYARANLLLLVDLNSRTHKTEFRIVRKVLFTPEFRVIIHAVDICRARYSSKSDRVPSTVNTVRKCFVMGQRDRLKIHRYGVPRNIFSRDVFIKNLDAGTESSMNNIDDHPPCASLYP